MPVPCLDFLEETITPIKIRIKIVNGCVYLIYFSISYNTTVSDPLSFNKSIYLFKSVNVNVSLSL